MSSSKRLNDNAKKPLSFCHLNPMAKPYKKGPVFA